MKVLLVHDHKFVEKDGDFYSSGGFAGEILQRYVDLFGEVTVVGRVKPFTNENKNLTKSSIDGVKFVIVPDYKSIRSYYKVLEAKKIIKQEVIKNDLVIARNSSMGDMAAGIAHKNKIKCLVECVSCSFDGYWNHSITGKFLAIPGMMKEKKTLKNAEYAVYVTNEFLQKRYPNNGKNIGCSDVELPKRDESILDKRLRRSYDDRILNIGTCAAVNVKYKNFNIVIKALSKLNKDGIKYRYIIAGGGDQTWIRSVIKKYNAEKYVELLGTVPHGEIFDYYEKIDIYIQPSKQEGLPRALLEAMSLGCMCIGSNTGGIPELLDKEYIFSKNNDESLIKILNDLEHEKIQNECKRNFQKAKAYNKKHLDEIRNKFYSSVASEIS